MGASMPSVSPAVATTSGRMTDLNGSELNSTDPGGKESDLLLEAAATSHVGLVRAHNEDSIRLNGDAGCYVLSDGMGGYNAGEVASAIAVEVVSKRLAAFKAQVIDNPDPDPVSALAEAIEASNRQIIETGALRPECLGMGATVVCAVLLDNKLWYAHVGDSRLYLFRDGTLRQLTKDHSVGQEMSDAGVLTEEQARNFHGRGVLTRALGVEPDVRPDVSCITVQAGDVYVMCSDGLSDMVTDEKLADTISKWRNTSCTTIGSALQQEALQGGGADNVSSIVIRCVATTV